MDFFDGVDGFFAPSVTIFCVVCRKGVSKIKFTTMMMVKQKRGRERQQASERERERETKRARFIGRFQTSFASFLVVFGTPSTPEREREREDRTRKRGGERLCPLIRFLSNDFKNVQRHESRKMETKSRLLPSIRELGPSRRSRSRPRTRVSVDLPPLVVVVVPLCVFEESVVWSRFVKAPLCSLDDESFL